jgi:hypothetical protein
LFEEQFNAASKATATKFGLPAIALDELPATVDLAEDYTISKKEVQWIVQKAKEDAEKIRTTDPKYTDPYNTKEFKAELRRIIELFGFGDEMFKNMERGIALQSELKRARALAMARYRTR